MGNNFSLRRPELFSVFPCAAQFPGRTLLPVRRDFLKDRFSRSLSPHPGYDPQISVFTKSPSKWGRGAFIDGERDELRQAGHFGAETAPKGSDHRTYPRRALLIPYVSLPQVHTLMKPSVRFPDARLWRPLFTQTTSGEPLLFSESSVAARGAKRLARDSKQCV